MGRRRAASSYSVNARTRRLHRPTTQRASIFTALALAASSRSHVSVRTWVTGRVRVTSGLWSSDPVQRDLWHSFLPQHPWKVVEALKIISREWHQQQGVAQEAGKQGSR